MISKKSFYTLADKETKEFLQKWAFRSQLWKQTTDPSKADLFIFSNTANLSPTVTRSREEYSKNYNEKDEHNFKQKYFIAKTRKVPIMCFGKTSSLIHLFNGGLVYQYVEYEGLKYPKLSVIANHPYRKVTWNKPHHHSPLLAETNPYVNIHARSAEKPKTTYYWGLDGKKTEWTGGVTDPVVFTKSLQKQLHSELMLNENSYSFLEPFMRQFVKENF